MDVTIREATSADVPSLEIVRRQAIEHGYSDVYDRGAFADLVAVEDADLGDRIASADVDVLVVESEVTVLAYGVFDRERGVVDGVYTAPDYEGEGWATRLLERFEALAREAGHRSIEAVVPRNALGFFRGRGFEERDRVDEEGLEARRMAKEL